jgi:general secretion pathway protein D
MYSGTETNVQVKRDSSIRTPAVQPASAFPAQQPVGANQQPNPALPNQNVGAPPGPGGVAPAPSGALAKLKFEPQSLSLKPGQEALVSIAVDNVTDLFSIPLLLQYNPAVISIEEVEYAAGEGGSSGFLSGGTQAIGIVNRIDKDKGQAIISATRQPNTPGVSGSGTLLALKIKALAAGNSNISIVQVNAKDSQQRLIPLVTSEATLQVQP